MEIQKLVHENVFTIDESIFLSQALSIRNLDVYIKEQQVERFFGDGEIPEDIFEQMNPFSKTNVELWKTEERKKVKDGNVHDIKNTLKK